MNINYMQTVPNSHSFGSLRNIIAHVERYNYYLEESKKENSGYVLTNQEPLTVEYLLIGFKNTLKREYEIASNGTQFDPNFVFTDINDIIKYLEKTSYDEKHFIKLIQDTLDSGLDLKCTRKMDRYEVYKLIDGERDYQDSRWGKGVPDKDKQVAQWLIFMEHHLEIAKNNIYNLSTDAALAEIRKITALGVRAMEIHGAPANSWTCMIPDKSSWTCMTPDMMNVSKCDGFPKNDICKPSHTE